MKRKQAPSPDSSPSLAHDDATNQNENEPSEPSSSSASRSKKPRKSPATKNPATKNPATKNPETKRACVWTEELDGVLLTAKASEKFSWDDIATFFPGRDVTSCKNRWSRLQKLPEARRAAQETMTTNWTSMHDTVLTAAKNKGMAWDEIAALLVGKNVMSCKNRWSRMKKKERDAGDAED